MEKSKTLAVQQVLYYKKLKDSLVDLLIIGLTVLKYECREYRVKKSVFSFISNKKPGHVMLDTPTFYRSVFVAIPDELLKTATCP